MFYVHRLKTLPFKKRIENIQSPKYGRRLVAFPAGWQKSQDNKQKSLLI